jgi:hypothetical protein
VFTDDEVKITCKGYCKGDYHGCCVGLPRHWAATSTTVMKVFTNHFICSSCVALPSTLTNFDAIWSAKFSELSNLVNVLRNEAMKNIKTNEVTFKPVDIDGTTTAHFDNSFFL